MNSRKPPKHPTPAQKPPKAPQSHSKRALARKVTVTGEKRPAYSSKTKRVLIIGGGISGYTLLHTIQQGLRKRGHRDVELTLVDANQKPGGWIQTNQAPYITELGPRSLLLRAGHKGGSADDRVRWLLTSLDLESIIIKPSPLANTKFLFRDGQFKNVNDTTAGRNSVIWRNIFSLAHYALGQRSSTLLPLSDHLTQINGDQEVVNGDQRDETVELIRPYDVAVLQHGDQYTRNLQRDAVVFGYRVDTDGKSTETFYHEQKHLLADKSLQNTQQQLDASLSSPTISPNSTTPLSTTSKASRINSGKQIRLMKKAYGAFWNQARGTSAAWIENHVKHRHVMLYNLFQAKQAAVFKFIMAKHQAKAEEDFKMSLFTSPIPKSQASGGDAAGSNPTDDIKTVLGQIESPLIQHDFAPLQLTDTFQAPHQHLLNFSLDNSAGLFHQLPHRKPETKATHWRHIPQQPHHPIPRRLLPSGAYPQCRHHLRPQIRTTQAYPA
jgi:glycerol-3-phosphate cytidylyltransferase-like family protein